MLSDLKSLLRRFPAWGTIIRSLVSKPSYVGISVLVLGVSIAAQLDLAAIVDATLLRPPSGRSPGEIAYVRSSLPSGTVSHLDFLDIRQRNTFFSGTVGYASWARAGLSHDDDSTLAPCGVVSGNFFPTLGVEPERGRTITDGDDVKGAEPVALVSAGLAARWKLEIASIIRINTAPFVVVGVLPAGFQGIERDVRPDVWIPCASAAILDRYGMGLITNRDLQWIHVAGRLKPGISLGNAQAELAAIAKQLQRENPIVNTGMDLTLDSFRQLQFLENDSARTMLLISGIVWFLFVLAFVNFFSLTLLRIFTRRRELAIKLAMGATRSDIGGWLLGELALVSGLAMAAGYFLGRIFLLLLRLDPSLARLVDTAGIAINWRPVSIVALMVLVCALVVWLLAVRAACRVDLQSAIRESSAAPTRRRIVTALYALQFALALFLLAMASAFVDALHTVAVRRLPFRSENLLLMDVNLRTMGLTDLKAPEFTERLLVAIRQLPGVIAASASSFPLLSTGGWTNLIIDGRDPALSPDKCFCRTGEVTPDFWQTVGISTLQGRTFTDADVAGKSPVGVINAAAARRFWPGGDAVGHVFRSSPHGPLITIIGVVSDVPQSTSSVIDPLYYRPSHTAADARMILHIAVQRDSSTMREKIRQKLLTLWPDKNVPPLRPIQDQIDLASASLVTAVRLVIWVAGFATLVTGCGLYFFSAFTASQYLKDAAIRLALGASQSDIILAHVRRYRSAIIAGLVLAALLLAGAQSILNWFNIAVMSPTITLIAIAAVPLAVITIVGLCVPLLGISRLNVYRVIALSE
jgi:predicted permease